MSDLVTVEAAEEFLALAPHAKFADVSGAGHMVAGDRNDAFTEGGGGVSGRSGERGPPSAAAAIGRRALLRSGRLRGGRGTEARAPSSLTPGRYA